MSFRLKQEWPMRSRLAVTGALAIALMTTAWSVRSFVLPRTTAPASQQPLSVESTQAPQDAPAVKPAVLASVGVAEHEVAPGDTLSGLFTQFGVDLTTLHAILAADEELLALDVLRPGTTLRFERAEDGETLQTLALVMHLGRTIFYRRVGDGVFEFEDAVSTTHWADQVHVASIESSFYASASQAGLSDADIDRVQQVFEERVDFRRDIHAGNRFEIVLGQELADMEPTGQTRIEGVRLRLGNRTESAFLHDDGNYYDAHGQGLSRAFLRYPTKTTYRVSSPFNLRRLHPVTHRIAPHHGVDFAMPIGTPILSTGDGVVVRTGSHPYAGNYLEIEHPGQFKTRYLHLSRTLVKRGQRVQRGQRIALSGNTGRSTGPHLHFELHVNSRPVNPLTAEIPTATRIPPSEMTAFSDKVRTLLAAMRSGETRIAGAGHTRASDNPS